MKLETLLKAAARASGVPYETILKDYAIGHLLAAIAAEPALADALVMKGGTALRKLYFGDDRFSEDLDFTSAGAPKGTGLEKALHSVATRTAASMSVSGPFSVTLERVQHKEKHPGEQEDFTFRVQFPWQRQALCALKVEVTADEPVLLPTASNPILHGYGEALPGAIRTCALEEIVAEELRSILPTKCAVRGATFQTVDDIVPPGLVALVTDPWEGDLGGVVAERTTAKVVMSALQQNIKVLFA